MFGTRGLQIGLTILCGVALLLGFFVPNPWIGYIGLLCGSYFALQNAWEAVKARALDVNILMVLAAIGAVAVGRVSDAVALLFLFSLSSTLESFAMARTKHAIEGLIKLRPSTGIRVVDGKDETVPVESLQIGDRVRIPPHTGIPCDGSVLEGQSAVDQSAMTGEAMPVYKGAGDLLLAGTMNQGSMLLMSVTAGVEDSTLAKIVNLVEDAQENKASGERVSTWFGERYTWFVLVIALAAYLVHILLGHKDPLYHALVLLVALSPCALVISTPATTLSALAYAARRGMLIRGGKFIELAGQIKAIAMDKTGTLTSGKPELVEICVCEPETAVVASAKPCHQECWSKGEAISEHARTILAAAAAIEQYSAHPIADAIVRKANEYGLDIPEADNHDALPGLGMRATIHGKTAVVGQMKLFEELGTLPPASFVNHLREMADDGLTVALFSYGDEFAAIGLRDGARENAPSVLKELAQLGIDNIVIATGDNAETASAIAREVGVTTVRAGLLPQEKEAEIDRLTTAHGTTMMIGDGINDAPSLARASVGVAMGGLGSDIALNAADVVLMNDNLDRIPELIRLGRKTNAIIRANLVFATGMICCLTLGSFFASLPLPLAVLGHEGSTVLVILNGLRVLRGPGR